MLKQREFFLIRSHNALQAQRAPQQPEHEM